MRILELLRDGEQSVSALQEALGLDSGGTSQHLAALRRSGLVETRRDGTTVFYRVAHDDVFSLLESARSIVTKVLAEQRALLEEIDAG